nr:PEPxxWA-CTERM sorting domain-containing protein [Polymorphobacter sp.]
MAIGRLLAAVAVGAAVGLAGPAAARPDQLIVFGDSLVDAGNAYLGTHGQTAQPGYGYFNGRYSNGPVWTDLINQRLTNQLTTPFLLGGNNYAVGGAEAAEDRSLQGFIVPGLASQLGIYATSGKAIDPNALYVLNFGNNDVSALLAGIAAAPNALAAAAFKANFTNAFVGNYLGAITYLNGHGASHFLIGGVPNPDIAVGLDLENALRFGFTTLHLSAGTSFTQIDYFGFFNALRNDPAAFGLPADLDTNLADACVNISLPPSNPHPDCSHYLSFDGIHPTAPVHAALARYVGELIGIGSVPEPSSWALIIGGFGLIGSSMRRSRAIAA